MDELKLEQSKRINKFLVQMKKDNKKMDDVFDDYEYMSKYLNDEDIAFFRNYIIEFKNVHLASIQKYIEENYVPEKCTNKKM